MLLFLMISGACKARDGWRRPLFLFVFVALAAFECETRGLVFFQERDDDVFENNRFCCIRPNALHRLFQ